MHHVVHYPIGDKEEEFFPLICNVIIIQTLGIPIVNQCDFGNERGNE